MSLKKICVISGSRADYGLLYHLLLRLKSSKKHDLNLVVTGSHLSYEFGNTYKSILNDGFFISKKVECCLSSDSSVGINKSIGLGVISFSEAYVDINPDLIIVLGDRYEIFASVISAYISKIPVAHISGGEITEGAFDDSLRHSITKMSQYHFVAHKTYRDRVIQLGENPEKVFIVGGMSLENIKYTKLLNKNNLEEDLDFKFGEKNILVTYHPVTLDNNSSEKHFVELLKALEKLEETNIIFTFPNSDSNSRIIFNLIKDFVKKNKNSAYYKSLGNLRYLSCLKYIDGVVGNSSSGIGEAPSFKIGTVNIGDRQKGRIKPISVIDCEPNENEIYNSIMSLFSPEFKKLLKDVKNPFDFGDASKNITDILENLNFSYNIKKEFHDIQI